MSAGSAQDGPVIADFGFAVPGRLVARGRVVVESGRIAGPGRSAARVRVAGQGTPVAKVAVGSSLIEMVVRKTPRRLP